MDTFSDTAQEEDKGRIPPASGTLDPLTMRARAIKRVPLPSKFFRGATSSLRLLPDFLLIGTQRGGTRALYHYLCTHPAVLAATTSDTHFFDRKYHRGLAWYRGHFPTRIERSVASSLHRHAFVTGEACSSYLFYPHTPRRVAAVLPEVRLIVLLRNPVDRAYSQYYHAVELGLERLSFEEAIRDEEERTAVEREKIMRLADYYSEDYTQRSYLSRGIYAEQLQAWMGLFAAEQFLILKSEDFYADPASSFKRVAAFLKLPQAQPQLREQDYMQYSHNTYSSGMDPQLRRRLSEYFEPHNARLYELLGVDFGWDG
jgi:hypothetical protein